MAETNQGDLSPQDELLVTEANFKGMCEDFLFDLNNKSLEMVNDFIQKYGDESKLSEEFRNSERYKKGMVLAYEYKKRWAEDGTERDTERI